MNLVVPASGALSLLFVSPRGTANRSVTVSVFVFPTSTVEPDDTVVSPVILISPVREPKGPPDPLSIVTLSVIFAST